jgi:cytoskeletal protein CcmA (bactofilin family)
MSTTGHPINSLPDPVAPEPVRNQMPGSMAPIAASNKAPITYIGKSLLIKGEVSGSEPIHVEGRIEGLISLPDSCVNISRDGVVMSNVLAGAVVVRGTLQGKLAAIDRVEIHSGGSLIGEVTAGRVSIEDGAYCQVRIDVRRPDPKAPLEINGNPTAE